MVLRKHSYTTVLIILIFLGLSIIPTVSAGPIMTKSTAAGSLTGKMIITLNNTVPYQALTWYLTDNALIPKILPLPYTLVCGSGYCSPDSILKNNSESGVLPAKITPYYPPKFWNYPPPGYMPLVPHTDPAIYYSETTTTAGITNDFEKKTGFSFS